MSTDKNDASNHNKIEQRDVDTHYMIWHAVLGISAERQTGKGMQCKC